jgi:hypothetical protein
MLLVVSPFLLSADLMLKIRTTAGAGRTSETTEYYKGHLMRRDYGTGYQVVDFSTGRSFSVNPEEKEYYPFDGAKMAMKRVVDPSHKIFIDSTYSATGEQREWFGYIASRYLTTKKTRDEMNGQLSGNRETHLDAWVLDLPVPAHVEGIASPNASFVLGFGPSDGVMKVPDLIATHSGPRPRGLVVRLKSEQYESEVIALSVAPLDESLFEVPKSFHEVTATTFGARPLSWSDQLSTAWLRVREWVANLLAS